MTKPLAKLVQRFKLALIDLEIFILLNETCQTGIIERLGSRGGNMARPVFENGGASITLGNATRGQLRRKGSEVVVAADNLCAGWRLWREIPC